MTLFNRNQHERIVGLKEWIVRYSEKIKSERKKDHPNRYMIELWTELIEKYKHELDVIFNDRAMKNYK